VSLTEAGAARGVRLGVLAGSCLIERAFDVLPPAEWFLPKVAFCKQHGDSGDVPAGWVMVTFIGPMAMVSEESLPGRPTLMRLHQSSSPAARTSVRQTRHGQRNTARNDQRPQSSCERHASRAPRLASTTVRHCPRPTGANRGVRPIRMLQAATIRLARRLGRRYHGQRETHIQAHSSFVTPLRRDPSGDRGGARSHHRARGAHSRPRQLPLGP
jgi:hypothetical protein